MLQVVQVMWGFMKVDANATHITCEVCVHSPQNVQKRVR